MNSPMVLAAVLLTAAASSATAQQLEDKMTVDTSKDRLTTEWLQQFECFDLWHMRNTLYASRGYRFTSPRGIEEFGSDGRTSDPDFTPVERANIQTIRAVEKMKNCKDGGAD